MRSIKNTWKCLSRKEGFTLIEMAIVILILGIGIAAFSPLYKNYLEKQATEVTKKNIDTISAAIGSFRSINGRYPCPASLSARRGDDNYGLEDCSNYNTVTPGTCTADNAICREASVRTITYMDPFTAGNPSVTGRPFVRVGAIPFRNLNLSEKGAYDGYDHRIKYSVTEPMMFDTTFRANQGGIDIQNSATPSPASILNPPGSAHFLVLSSGKNGYGAFTKAGTQMPCASTKVTGSTLETTNCDNSKLSTYTFADVSTKHDRREFDDVMTYFTQSEVPLWQLSTRSQGAIMQKPDGDVGMVFANANLPFISPTSGIGTADALIGGVLRVADDPTNTVPEGYAMANQFCPDTGPGSDCFNTQRFAENNNTGIKCPVGKYMQGIANGQPICGTGKIKCPNGTMMTGIDPNGEIVCSGNTSCPEQTAPLCDLDHTLPASPANTIHRITAGLTMYIDFKCINSIWTQIAGPGGVCTCDPLEDETRNGDCGFGFTGTLPQTREWICPTDASPDGTMPYWTEWHPPASSPGGSGTVNPGPTCDCVGGTQDMNNQCPPGLYPVPSQSSRNFVCNPDGSGTWTEWAPPFTCQCDIQNPDPIWVPCGGNYPAHQYKSIDRDMIACPNTWGPWYDVDTSACHCTERTEQHPGPCPNPGDIGTAMYETTFHCPSGTTGPTLVPGSDSECAPPEPVVCQWTSNTFVGNSPTHPGGKRLNSGCTCGEPPGNGVCWAGYSGNYEVWHNCTCGGS